MQQNVHKKFTDRQNELRLFIIEFTVSEGRPYHIDNDMETALKALHMEIGEYKEIIAILKERDGMVAAESGEVNFIYPVSALETGHQVTLADGRRFSAMCAIDAIGAAFTFHQDTEIDSSCAVCGEPVRVVVKDGEVAEYAPEELHALTFPLGELENWAGDC